MDEHVLETLAVAARARGGRLEHTGRLDRVGVRDGAARKLDRSRHGDVRSVVLRRRTLGPHGRERRRLVEAHVLVRPLRPLDGSAAGGRSRARFGRVARRQLGGRNVGEGRAGRFSIDRTGVCAARARRGAAGSRTRASAQPAPAWTAATRRTRAPRSGGAVGPSVTVRNAASRLLIVAARRHDGGSYQERESGTPQPVE
jgi:hypothetical protein